MKQIILLLLICFSNEVLCQEKQDSLHQIVYQLESLGKYHYNEGNNSVAIDLLTQSLSIKKNIFGEEHPTYANTLVELAKVYIECRKYSLAINYMLKAIDIQKRTLGLKHVDYIKSEMTLASLYSSMGLFDKSIPLASEATKIYKEEYGATNNYYADLLGNYSTFIYDAGDYSGSAQLCKEAIEIYKYNGKTESEEYATLLINFAKCKSMVGYDIEAIKLAEKAANIYYRICGKNHHSYAVTLNCLAVFYSSLGDYKKAISYETQAMNIFKKLYGNRHYYYANSLQNLSSYYLDMGDYKNSFQFVNESIEIIEKEYGKDNNFYASAVDALSDHWQRMNNYTKALCYEEEVLKVLKKTIGTNHPSYAHSLKKIAKYYSELGDNRKAYDICKETIIIVENVYGRNSLYYADILDDLSYYCYSLGIFNESVLCKNKAIDYFKTYISRNFIDMTYDQRSLIWEMINTKFIYYPGLAFRTRSADIIPKIYNSTLFTKGLLLNTDRQIKKYIQVIGSYELDEKYSNYLSCKNIYNRQMNIPISDRCFNLDSLYKEIQIKENVIIQELKKNGDYTTKLDYCWEDIIKKLNPEDISIEFLSFPIQNDSIMYVALTLRKDSESPKMTILFEDKQLKQSSDTAYYQCKDMTDLVWKPLLPELQGIKNIYFSPSGALYNIGIEYLPGMENYNIYRLSSTRELVTSKKIEKKNLAVLYGGLDYDARFDKSATGKNPTMLDEVIKERANVRGMGLRGGKEYLKHTKEEVNIIGKELNNANWECVLDTAAMGTEESFKALSGRKVGCLHISTHGFYYNKEDADNARYKFMLIDNNMVSDEDRTLTRSGLVMSGANHILEDEVLPVNVEDGILTAKEIADIDLRGLDLVVLSACQTGLGDIAQGEGVFGLQRGFKKAGANSILMSLWEVDDKATQIMMTQFYRNLLSGQSKRQSLLSAQKYLRKVDSGRYDEPKYWAAFILLDGIN